MVIYRCLPNKKNTDSLKFRLALAQGLMGKKNGSGVPHPVHSCPPIELLPKRLTEQHFPECIPATGKKARPKRKCAVCIEHGKRRESVSWCSECEAGISLDGCFMSYHTNLKF
jgi:hypothetical protein